MTLDLRLYLIFTDILFVDIEVLNRFTDIPLVYNEVLL